VASVKRVRLPIVDEEGRERGTLEISLLLRTKAPAGIPLLVDERGDPDRAPDLEPVQLLEGKGYLYSIEIPGESGVINVDKDEIFWPDTDRGDRGRLWSGLNTGTVHVQIQRDGAAVGTTAFEVRPAKLDYLQSYRWMLRDIAATTAELTMYPFAPAEQRFAIDPERDAETLYQRFAFLHSLLASEDFQASMQQILTRPHVTWEEVEHISTPAERIRASSALARALTGPGPRVPRPGAPRADPLRTLPTKILTTRTETSVDNAPNRFVRFALERWRGIIAEIGAEIVSKSSSLSVKRGIREVAAVLAQLDALLAADLFREVRALTHFPGGNQVLLKRDGYRYILSAYVQFELSARLTWSGLEDVYWAGQRNVAKLYEYWVYMQLCRIVVQLCNGSFDAGQLIEPSKDKLVLHLRAGERCVFTGKVKRLGRALRLELWFNRTFPATTGEDDREGSWTRQMRPDCSLLVTLNPNPEQLPPTWIHFDAKYRSELVIDVFGPPLQKHEEETSEEQPEWKPQDLHKMHTYKDAIRRSIGSYVIYPGADGGSVFREHHELFAGVGAFALRPATGDAEGTQALVAFIDKAITHLASQTTQHERGRYWEKQSYSGRPPDAPVEAASFLTRPPADVMVLLVYTENAAHRAWIARERLYALHADTRRSGAMGVKARKLSADYLIVYSEAPDEQVDLYQMLGTVQLMTAEQLRRLGYPGSRGKPSICLSLAAIPVAERPSWLTGDAVRRAHLPAAPEDLAKDPVTVSWSDLALGSQSA
jgi:uncharacterized protein